MNNYEADNDTHSHTTPGLWNSGGYGRFYQVDLTLSDTQPVYTYNISYELNGGTNAPGNPTTYTNLTGATLADATKTGYTFDGWYDNAGFNGTAITYIQPGPTGDKTVYAKWTAITYTVSFNANGGTGTMSNQSFTYNASQALTSNTFTRTGYSFAGWATTAGGNVVYTDGQTVSNLASTQNANVTLYAKWSLLLSYFWGAGDGSEDNPYIITTKEGLNLLATLVNSGSNDFSGKYFLQTADITLNGSFTPIGNNYSFDGTYDGGNKTISGLVVSETYDEYVGLFGRLFGGTVKNVILVSPNVTNSRNNGANVGAVVGSCEGYKPVVDNCHVINPTVSATGSGTNYVGAIIGEIWSSNATVTNCYFYDSNTDHNYAAYGDKDQGATVTNVGLARKVTLGSGMANVSPEATNTNGFVCNNETYYREGLTLTLTDNLGTTSEGYTKHYYANGTDLNGSTYTVTDGDVSFTAACRSNGQSYAVTYVDANGTEHSTNAIPLDGSMTSLNGTYYVGANITFTSTITLNGNTNLILANGKTMNVGTSDNRISGIGIKCNKNYKDYTLTIYGQSLDEATAGHLSIYNSGDDGIYLNSYNQQSGNVTVNSTTGNYYTIDCKYFTLSGGKLNAINNNTGGDGINGSNQIRILGGQLDTYVSNNSTHDALYSLSGSITLG